MVALLTVSPLLTFTALVVKSLKFVEFAVIVVVPKVYMLRLYRFSPKLVVPLVPPFTPERVIFAPEYTNTGIGEGPPVKVRSLLVYISSL